MRSAASGVTQLLQIASSFIKNSIPASSPVAWFASMYFNVQGEAQKKLDVLSNDIFIKTTEWGGHLLGMASEEMDEALDIPEGNPKGRYLIVFDPLDGSSNIDVTNA